MNDEEIAIVPKLFMVKASDLRDAMQWFAGDDEPDSEVLMGFTIGSDDDGIEHYGLHMYSAEYPEEGGVLIKGLPMLGKLEVVK